ncbi:MAG: 2-amino-4-hydroxy-6-hydroxymethyldihydropteridine diphosphokinase [Lachnospiraceae bacterium]
MDSVIIEGLEVYCNHGVFPEENKLGQKFIVNMELYTDTRKAGLTDQLDKSIDYGEVCHFVNDYMKNHTFQLIEAVAENLARELLHKISGLKEVTIEIKKPWAPIGLPMNAAGVRITRKWHTAYIAIGSNMGNRQGYLDFAADEIDGDENCVLLKIADTIETKPYGMEDQDDFLNSCMEIRTLYYPKELLKVCKAIEKKANRVKTVHWGPRTLDLDIIFYDDEIVSEDNLVIPHIEMQKRDFVLRPLAQIAPNKVHPLLKKRVIDLYEELKSGREEA